MSEKFKNNFGVTDCQSYKAAGIIAVIRKFTRGERIAPLGESRFPEQFLADNTRARLLPPPDRSRSVEERKRKKEREKERDVRDRFYWIFLEICRRDGTGRATRRGRHDSPDPEFRVLLKLSR